MRVAIAAWALTGCTAGEDTGSDVAAREGAGGSTTAAATSTTATPEPMVVTSTTVAGTGSPVPADTPAGLAAQLTEAERTIRDRASPPAALASAGHTQQVAYGRLSVREEWQAEVVALVPPALRPVVEANLTATTELARQAAADVAAHGGASPATPDWRVVAPLPAAELLAEYRAGEAAIGIPWQYLAAIHFVESRMGRIRGNSIAGAQGPMQFLPSTWDIYGAGGDIDDTGDAILAAARLLQANGGPSDMASALYAYNPSNRYVRAVTAYAEQMMADERAYLGYYHWQVYYSGRLLPEGYGS